MNEVIEFLRDLFPPRFLLLRASRRALDLILVCSRLPLTVALALIVSVQASECCGKGTLKFTSSERQSTAQIAGISRSRALGVRLDPVDPWRDVSAAKTALVDHPSGSPRFPVPHAYKSMPLRPTFSTFLPFYLPS